MAMMRSRNVAAIVQPAPMVPAHDGRIGARQVGSDSEEAVVRSRNVAAIVQPAPVTSTRRLYNKTQSVMARAPFAEKGFAEWRQMIAAFYRNVVCREEDVAAAIEAAGPGVSPACAARFRSVGAYRGRDPRCGSCELG